MPTIASGNTILPSTTGRFGLIQITDAYGRNGLSIPPGTIEQIAPHYDSVWGAFSPGAWNATHPGMIVSRYVLPNEDIKLISGHDLAWFQQNHPDWILYACTSNGTPTHDLAGTGTSFGDIPLDIHNPAVVQYQLGLIGPDMVSEGYNTIAADNITFENYLYDASAPTSGGYGCGVYQGANYTNFVYRYGGQNIDDHNVRDAAFTADLLNWLATARSYLNSNYGSRHYHIIVNHPFDGSTPDANELQMFQYIDGLLYEPGFTHYGTLDTGSTFQTTLNWMATIQGRNLAIFLSDYFCHDTSTTQCSTDPFSLTAHQMDWALASYALGNNGGADVYISPAGGAIDTYRGEEGDRYGAPCGAYTQSNGYLYTRQFAGGFAVVNATSGSQVVTLPAGHTYKDVEGRAISNPLTVGPTDAYMLLTTGNGCS
jgi:hypothetical protein